MSRERPQTDMTERTSSKLDYSDRKIDFPRIAVVLSLGASAALCLYNPIGVFGVPILITEAFLFILYTRAAFRESLIVMALLALIVLIAPPFKVLGFGLVMALFVQFLIVKLVLRYINIATITEAVIASYVFIIPILATLLYLDHEDIGLVKLQISRKILEGTICIVIFQVVDKGAIYLSRKYGYRVPVFANEMSLKEFVQTIFTLGFSALFLTSLFIDLSNVRARLLFEDQYFTKLTQKLHGEEVKVRTDAIFAERHSGNLTSERILTSTSPPVGSRYLSDIHLVDAALAFTGQTSAEIGIDPKIMPDVAVMARYSFVILPADSDSDGYWRLVSRYGENSLAVYKFADIDSMSRYFSTEDVTVTFLDREVRGRDLVGVGLKKREENSINDVLLYDDEDSAIWVRSDRTLGSHFMLSAMGPGSSFLTYMTRPMGTVDGGTFAFAATISAWPLISIAFSEFSSLAILGFALLGIVLILSGVFGEMALRPLKAYTEDAHSSARKLAKDPNKGLDIPRVRETALSEAKQAQEAFSTLFGSIADLGRQMQDSNRSYNVLVSTMGLGVMAVDSNGGTVSVNECLAEICRLDIAALESIKTVGFNMPFSLGLEDGVNEDVESGDGGIRNLTIKKTQRLGEGGKTDGFWLVVVDNTLEKLKDAQLAQASKLATLGQMSTEIAHELNQPLNVLSICQAHVASQLARPKIDKEKISEKLSRMKGAIDRAARIINHMRTYGRVQTDSLALIDARESIQGALTMMEEQLKLLSIEVTYQDPGYALKILGDTTKFEQVLVNLVSNAKDAVLEHAKEPRITISGEEITGKILITVSDNGGGVPETDLFKIFEPFFTTKLVGEGTGLGGSISYGIVKEMGGVITAENADGGLRVTITLPAHGGELEISKSSRLSEITAKKTLEPTYTDTKGVDDVRINK